MAATRLVRASLALCVLFQFPVALASETDVLQRYEEMLNAQAELIDSLTDRVQRLEARLAVPTESLEATPSQAASPERSAAVMRMDEVGDLNVLVRAGENPGSIMLPGPSNVSIGFGGYVKSLGYVDNNAETEDEYFLPALLGVRRPDRAGQYRSTSDLSRFALEGDRARRVRSRARLSRVRVSQ